MQPLPPETEERTQYILRELSLGKNREQLAEEMGNKNWKSIDMYMRRRGYKWDQQESNYVLKDLPKKEYSYRDSTKAGTVIALLAQEGSDLREVAKQLGYSDYRELAKYMDTKGYIWDSEEGNYKKRVGKIEEEEAEEETVAPVATKSHSFSTSEEDAILSDEHLELLELLANHKERLIDLLLPTVENGKLPRYSIPGTAKSKTIQMSHLVEQILVDYSREKNITQRELVEVALIEFLRRYGYKEQVERLLR